MTLCSTVGHGASVVCNKSISSGVPKVTLAWLDGPLSRVDDIEYISVVGSPRATRRKDKVAEALLISSLFYGFMGRSFDGQEALA